MLGDFTGFSFDGIHTSELGILRVSDGDRYEEELHPDIKDRTIEIPGNNGEYYFGSDYGTKEYSVSIAFDSMTEKQFRQMRRLFGTKKICRLIFDERPYKVYLAKIKEPVEVEYICFDEPKKTAAAARDGIRRVNRDTEDEGWEQVTPYEYSDEKQRIYKGEGKINFVSYFPFAKQQFKTLEEYERPYSEDGGNTFTTYANVDEWKESSGILTAAQRDQWHIDKTLVTQVKVPREGYYRTEDTVFDSTKTYYECDSSNLTYFETSDTEFVEGKIYYELTTKMVVPDDRERFNLSIPVYNPGDLNVGFQLYIPFDTKGKIKPYVGDLVVINGETNSLYLKDTERLYTKDTGILINSVNHLIEGVIFDSNNSTWVLTGSLYNQFIAGGDFPLIKRSDWRLDDTHYEQSIRLNLYNDGLLDGAAANDIITGIQIFYDYLYF